MKTFKEAQTYCASEGGTLAMPKTDQQQDFIEILMQQSHSETFWIGLDDLEEEKVHRWADGKLLDYKNGDYNRYLKGHPDKMYQTEDCVENVSKYTQVSIYFTTSILDQIARWFLLER